MLLANGSGLKSLSKRTPSGQAWKGYTRRRVRRMGLRRSRYIGEPRTHLQHVVTATAMNVCRVHDWLEGVVPHSTPLSHFARFMKEAA
jgi:transposase